MAEIEQKWLKMAFDGNIFITITSVGISNDHSCQNTVVPTSNIQIETIFPCVFLEKVLNFDPKITKGKHKIGIFSEGHNRLIWFSMDLSWHLHK